MLNQNSELRNFRVQHAQICTNNANQGMNSKMTGIQKVTKVLVMKKKLLPASQPSLEMFQASGQ